MIVTRPSRRPARTTLLVLAVFLAACGWASPSLAAPAELVERLDLSRRAFEELMASADSSVPDGLLKKCEAVVIFPRTLNVAWGIGGQYGKGVALRRDRATGRWSAPAFYTIGGLTIGPQIGGQAVDIVLVVMNEKGFKSLLESKCTLGGDAGIALGPAGRNATASTDLGLRAEIYSYSRAKGLYVGLSLKGAVIRPDSDANAAYHGRRVTARQILVERAVGSRPEDRALLGALRRASSGPWPAAGWIAAACAAAFVLGLGVAASRRRK